MVEVCGTPGEGDGSGVTGMTVTVPRPVPGAGALTIRLRVKSFGTSFELLDVAVTLKFWTDVLYPQTKPHS